MPGLTHINHYKTERSSQFYVRFKAASAFYLYPFPSNCNPSSYRSLNTYSKYLSVQ